MSPTEQRSSGRDRFKDLVPETLRWQKSSYSGGGADEDCLEIAATPAHTLHLRESDTPITLLSPTTTTLNALLTALKQG